MKEGRVTNTGRWLLVAAAAVIVVLVTGTFVLLRRVLLPPPAIREYIEENPEVLSTLPRGVPDGTSALDDSIAEAMRQFLDSATSRLPPAEQDEARALRKKMAEVGASGMTRDEVHRLKELDHKCLTLLSPAERERWLTTVRRLSEQPGEDTDR